MTTGQERKSRQPAAEPAHPPEFEQVVDQAVAAGLLQGREGAKNFMQMPYKRFVESLLQGEPQAQSGRCFRPQARP